MLGSDAEDVYLDLHGPDSAGSWVVAREGLGCPPTPGSSRRRSRGPRTTGTTKVASETDMPRRKRDVL